MSAGPQRRSVALPASGMLPRVGKIRLGVKTAKGAPSKSDYFVVVEDESGITSAEAAAAFHEVYPDQPRVLRCLLPSDAPSEIADGAYRLYGTGKLKRKCDGATCDERTATGLWVEKPCVCLAKGLPEDARECKLTYTLNVILPDVSGVGVWQVETGSVISASRIGQFLNLAMSVTAQRPAFLPFSLHLVTADVNPLVNGRTINSKVYVLDPRIDGFTPRDVLGGGVIHRPRPSLDGGGAEVALPALPPPAADDAEDELLHHEGGVVVGEIVDEPRGEAEPLLVVVKRGLLTMDADARDALLDAVGVPGNLRKARPAAEFLIDAHGEEARDLNTLLLRLVPDDDDAPPPDEDDDIPFGPANDPLFPGPSATHRDPA